MTIKYKDYLMEADKEGGFNLMKNVVRNKTEIVDGKKVKLDETYDDIMGIGYNMSLRNCASKIAHFELCEEDGTFTLKEAVNLWNSKLEEIKNAINL